MDGFEFNRTIERRWKRLYDAQIFTNSEVYKGVTYRALYTYSFLKFINFPPVTATEILSRTDEETSEWFKSVIAYIEEHEDMIDFWLL